MIFNFRKESSATHAFFSGAIEQVIVGVATIVILPKVPVDWVSGLKRSFTHAPISVSKGATQQL